MYILPEMNIRHYQKTLCLENCNRLRYGKIELSGIECTHTECLSHTDEEGPVYLSDILYITRINNNHYTH